jgi:hypothetical protein
LPISISRNGYISEWVDAIQNDSLSWRHEQTIEERENQKLISSNSFSPENCDSLFLINKTIIVEKLFLNSGNISDACF